MVHHYCGLNLSIYAFVSDDKASIKEWMAGKNKNICGKDLITDFTCVPGYEADFVIYLGPNDRGVYLHVQVQRSICTYSRIKIRQ